MGGFERSGRVQAKSLVCVSTLTLVGTGVVRFIRLGVLACDGRCEGLIGADCSYRR